MPSIDTTNSPVSQPSSTTGTAQTTPVAAPGVTPAPIATQVATATPADGYRPPSGHFAQRELDRAAHHDTRVIGAGTDFVGNVEVKGEVRVQALDSRNDTDPQRNASGKEFLATTFNGKVVVGAQMIRAKKDISFRAVLPTSIATEDSSFGKLVKAIAPAIRALPSDLKKLDADAPFTIAEAKRLPSGGEF